MRIFLDPIVLADMADLGLEDMANDAQDKVQEVNLLNASAADFINRRNRVYRLEFARTYSFDTFAACELFWLSHAAAIPTSGDIEIWLEGEVYSGDDAVDPILWHNATVHAYRVKQIGRSCTFRYTISGGTLEFRDDDDIT